MAAVNPNYSLTSNQPIVAAANSYYSLMPNQRIMAAAVIPNYFSSMSNRKKVNSTVKKNEKSYSKLKNYYKIASNLEKIYTNANKVNKEAILLERIPILQEIVRIEESTINETAANSNNPYVLYIKPHKLGAAIFNLAEAYETIGDLDEALITFKKALKIYINATLIDRHRGMNVAEISNDIDIAIRESDSRTISCISAIGDIYYKKGDFDNALENHQKAIHLRIKNYEKIMKEFEEIHRQINSPLSTKNNTLEIAKIKLYARQLDKKILLEHGRIALSLINIGNVYKAKGDLQNALAHYREALAIRTKVFGSNDKRTLAVTRSIVKIMQNNNKGGHRRTINSRNMHHYYTTYKNNRRL